MRTAEEIIKINQYANEILELIENQLKNNEYTLTWSDVQGVAEALVMRILDEGKQK